MSVVVRRIKIRNYKSIASCDVNLHDLCVLTGANGSGKSNFVDAFGFISDAVNSTLDTAIRNRGGINSVRRKSTGHPNNFGMSFFIKLRDSRNGFFAFEIGALPGERFEVKRERLHISGKGSVDSVDYEIERGEIKHFSLGGIKPDIRSDRFFLTAVSGLRPIDLLFDALSRIQIYNINPEDYRLPQPHQSGEFLLETGENLASVLRGISERSPTTFRRIKEYLRKITRGVQNIAPKSLGPTETIEFSQAVQGATNPWRFNSLNMSNGTLRSLGVLVALFQDFERNKRDLSLIGIEEPEGTIHPAAASVLMDAIIEASSEKQVLITTHSPELLDHPDLSDEQIYIVESDQNQTRISLTDSASRDAMRRHLLTAGELLRKNQFRSPSGRRKPVSQTELFSISE